MEETLGLNLLLGTCYHDYLWRRSGLMVSALLSRSSGPGASPGWGHCFVFLGKTLYSHSASLHPGIYMGTGEFNINAGVTLRWTSIPFRGSTNTPSRRRNRDKLRLDGPLGSYAALAFTYYDYYMTNKITLL